MKLNNKEFDRVFEALGSGKILLISDYKLDKDKTIYFADRIFTIESFGARYLFYSNIFGEAYNYNKRDLYFMLRKFKGCKYWKVISIEKYNNIINDFDKVLDKKLEI